MEDKLIMTAGDIEYPFMNKPVRYTNEFLQSLTGDYGYEVCDEHDGAKITNTNSIYYKDNGLYASFEDDFDTKDKGFSTVISLWELEEYPDYYLPIPDRAKLEGVDLVSNPKFTATVLNNSEDIKITKSEELQNVNEVDTMSSEMEDKIRENGALKQQLNDRTKLEETLRSQIEELEKQVSNRQEEIDELRAEIEKGDEAIKEKYAPLREELKAYKDREKANKKSIAVEIAESQISDDVEDKDKAVNELAEELTNLSIDSLRAMKEANSKKPVQDTAFKGVPSGAKPVVEQPKPKSIDEIGADMTMDEFDDLTQKLHIRI